MKKINVDREGFTSILSTLMPGIAKKEILAQSTHIMLLENGVATYNDSIAVMVPFEFPFECSVPAKEFYSIVASCKGEELTLSFEDDVLYLECGDTNADFAVSIAERKAEELLNTICPWDIEDDQWTTLTKDFLTGLRLVRFGAEKAMTQENYYTIKISEDMAYTAGEHRVSRYNFTETIGGEFKVPATVVDKIESGCWDSIAIEDTWVHLKDSVTGAIFSTRTITGIFSDVDAVLDDLDEEDGVFVEFPEELSEAIEGMMVLYAETPLFEREMHMEVKDNKLKIVGKQGERNKVTKHLPITSEVDFSFTVNPSFIKEVLTVQNRALVFEGHGCLFKSADERFVHFMTIHANV